MKKTPTKWLIQPYLIYNVLVGGWGLKNKAISL